MPVDTHRACAMKRPARRSPTPSAPAPLSLWCVARPAEHGRWHMKRTIDELHRRRASCGAACPGCPHRPGCSCCIAAAIAAGPDQGPGGGVARLRDRGGGAGRRQVHDQRHPRYATAPALQTSLPRRDSGGGGPDKFAPLSRSPRWWGSRRHRTSVAVHRWPDIIASITAADGSTFYTALTSGAEGASPI